MIVSTPPPFSLRKTAAFLARWTLGLVLAVWLVFGLVWGALHWLIVPRIGDFRVQLEARATQVLGVPVRIGRIQAYASGMVPAFELTEVRLLDAQGRDALRLPRVLAALSPRSLMRLGFEQLSVERPVLDIRRTRDGRLYVAGLDFSGSQGSERGAADWFFSQREFAIQDGTIQWTDELKGLEPLALTDVSLVVRNQGRRHDLRLDATPPEAWGERFSVRGLLTQPLLSRLNGDWQQWDGQLYAAFSRVDLSALHRYAALGVDLHQGAGALRAWADVKQGQLTGGTADVALSQLSLTLGQALKPLALRAVQARLGVSLPPGGLTFSTQGLAFDTEDGLRWPGGNVQLAHQGARGRQGAQGSFTADRLDLAALSHIADRLPLSDTTRTALQAYAPQGLVQQVQASWQGPLENLQRYEVRGAVSQLALAAVGDAPGLRGADLNVDFNQAGGRASVAIHQGSLALPTFFEEPVIDLTQLEADVRWQIKGDQVAVQMPKAIFHNADARGEAQLKWSTSDPARSSSKARFPGVLDLQATLYDAQGTRVHRYLPSVIDVAARDYVRDAIQAGTAREVRFKVKGDLNDVPFAPGQPGEFKISADVENATLAYVPRRLQDSAELPWPPLTQIQGALVIDRLQLQVKQASARAGAGGAIQIKALEANISDLTHAVIQVSAGARGPLPEVLGFINGSPVGAMMDHALGQAVVSAAADYTLKLTLPLAHLEQSSVQGSVTLGGNDVQITPTSPKLTRARGVVSFSEKGFAVTGGQARMLGGDVRLDGGTVAATGTVLPVHRAPAALQFRASGTVSAEGLRQARELGFVAGLARHASGSAAYTAQLAFRAGQPELMVSSTLQGLSLGLPAPLNKSADAVLPLRLESALIRESLLPGPDGAVRWRDQWSLDLGRLAAVLYQRDLSGTQPRVLRGSIAVGLAPDESVPLPDTGVAANVNLSALDVDAWGRVLSQAAGVSLNSLETETPNDAMGYLPNSLAVRAGELTAGGRQLHQVVVGASRDGLLWRANLDAQQLNGYLEYRQSSDQGPGRVHARLARLTMAPQAVGEVEALLHEQPTSIPALDIVVDNLELRGKRLGRVEVEAVNRGADGSDRESAVREWRLNKFNMITPEAVLTASGNWASLQAQSGAPGRRRTVMNFKLDISDAGALLTRLGMKDVVRNGHGRMAGQVAWVGSPITLDYPSMTGDFTVNVEDGQFLKADPGLAKLLGVLSLQSLPRRLTLDFRDVFSEGFAFDFFRGDVNIALGIARTNNLQMKGVNAAVLMEGRADLARETQNLHVVVVPELNAGTASLIASVINPAVGLGTFLAQVFLRRPLIEAATQELQIDGSWTDPRVTKVERGSRAPKEETP